MAKINYFDPFDGWITIHGTNEDIKHQIEFLIDICQEDFKRGYGTGDAWFDYKIEVSYDEE